VTKSRNIRRPVRLLLALGAVAFGIATDAAAPRAAGRQTERTQITDADRETTMRVCSNCHDAERLTGSRRSRDQWTQVIDNMIAAGAKANDEEYETVLRYLLATSGRVNVNRDPARELTAVLGVSQEDASRIVEYRQTHGRFEDFDALLKVPSIDSRALQERRDAIAF